MPAATWAGWRSRAAAGSPGRRHAGRCLLSRPQHLAHHLESQGLRGLPL